MVVAAGRARPPVWTRSAHTGSAASRVAATLRRAEAIAWPARPPRPGRRGPAARLLRTPQRVCACLESGVAGVVWGRGEGDVPRREREGGGGGRAWCVSAPTAGGGREGAGARGMKEVGVRCVQQGPVPRRTALSPRTLARLPMCVAAGGTTQSAEGFCFVCCGVCGCVL